MTEALFGYPRGAPPLTSHNFYTEMQSKETVEKVICPIGDKSLLSSTRAVGSQSQLNGNGQRTRQGRPVSLFPTDPNLPWHTSWIDDGRIGGCSVPNERQNFPALYQGLPLLTPAGVKLIVNLMESPVSAVQAPECASCELTQVAYDESLFEDVRNPDFCTNHESMKMLWIPVNDGSVPKYEQIATFLTHVNETIAANGKVMVHCQAGVGRTGTFLAIYLMAKHNLTANEAIAKLRHERPQSMQYFQLIIDITRKTGSLILSLSITPKRTDATLIKNGS
jgi:predicted protein tyrosine phosphatase